MISRPLIIRFIEKLAVNYNNQCWEWQFRKNACGYGTIKVKNKSELAHRISYTLLVGEIPKGVEVCHSCDNRCCVNPEHLWLGTHKENMQDRVNKGYTKGIAQGEKNPREKLKETDIPVIRELYKMGYDSVVLGAQYGVSSSTISSIIRRESWNHVN